MWRITMVLNALLMGVFGLGSAVSQIRLHNLFVRYPQSGEKLFGGSDTLPAISLFALHHHWLYQAIPLAWALGVLAILIGWRKNGEKGNIIAGVHTSATLLVGVIMFLFFVAAGVMPFVPLVVGIAK